MINIEFRCYFSCKEERVVSLERDLQKHLGYWNYHVSYPGQWLYFLLLKKIYR